MEQLWLGKIKNGIVILLTSVVLIGCLNGLAVAGLSYDSGVQGVAPPSNYSGAVNTITSATPNLFSGLANQSYTIEVPSGRNGLQPALALTYSGKATNGWLGLGWDLEVGSIQRQVKNGVDYSADDYVFKTASGGIELVKIPGTSEYRAKQESGYVRFKKIGNDPSSYWEVTDKSGRKMYFGQTGASQQKSSDGTKLYKWCLNKVQDTHGNNISYTYSKDSGQIYLNRISYSNHASLSAFNDTNEILFHQDSDRLDILSSYQLDFKTETLKRLRSIEVRTNDQLFAAYKITYQDSELTTSSRLTAVQRYGADATIDAYGVITRGTALPQTLYQYHQEEFSFNQTSGPTIPISKTTNNAGFWTGIDMDRLRYADFNGDGKIDMIRFLGGGRFELYYSDGTSLIQQPEQHYVAVPAGLGATAELGGFHVADFNGDGKADLLQQEPTPTDANPVPLRIYYAEDGGFSAAVYGPAIYCQYREDLIRRSRLGDYNGDGKTDFGWINSTIGGAASPMEIYLSEESGFSVTAIDGPAITIKLGEILPIRAKEQIQVEEGVFFPPIKSNDTEHFKLLSPSIDFARVKSGDFNGDGKTDIVVVGNDSATKVYLSDGMGFTQQITGPVFPKIYYPEKLYYFQVGDFNGDGKSDIARFRYDSNAGGAGKTCEISLSTGAEFEAILYGPATYHYAQINLADFNGDGKTDIIELPLKSGDVFSAPIQVHLAKNQSGTNYLFKTVNGPTLDVDLSTSCIPFDYKSVNFGDINGDGQLDIIKANGYDSDTNEPLSLYLSNNSFANLLASTDNGTGGTSTIRYQSSSDSDNGGNLPIVFPVLESITTNDGNGVTSTTEFAFDGGYFHKGEKEFRGFNHAKVTGPQVGTQARKIDETWFHQGDGLTVDQHNPGALVANMQGRPYRQRTSDSDGTIYAEVEIAYHQDLDSGPSYFNPTAQVDSYGLNGVNSNFHTRTRTPAYDSYGNVLLQINEGDITTDHDDVTVAKSYLYNTTSHLVGLVKSETIYKGQGSSGVKKAQVSYYYDENLTFPSTTTAPFATMANKTHSTSTPTRGSLTSIVRWNDLGPDIEEYLQYDAYGNPTAARDGNGNVSALRYDPSFTFPLQKINALGHTETTTYYGVDGQQTNNGLYGQPLSVTDDNGASITYKYDKLGRATNQTLIDGSWTSTAYVDLGTVGRQHIYTTNNFGLWSRSYFDGSGRNYRATKAGPDGKPLASRTKFDARGLAIQSSLPYFEGEETPQYATMTYDVVGRQIRVDLPDGTRQLSSYENTVQVTIDANNHRRRQTADAHGRLAKVEDYQGEYTNCDTTVGTPYSTTRYGYDAIGNLTQVTDTYGNKTQMGYDSLSRKVFMRDPDMGDWSYNYDSNSNLIYQRDAKGQIITFSYDALSRLVRKAYPTTFDTMQGLGGGGENTFAFINNETELFYPISVDGTGQSANVAASEDVLYRYDDPSHNYAIGKLTTMTDSSGSTEYYYDHPLDLTTRIIKNIGIASYTITSETDSLGRLKTLTYPDGEAVNYNYDSGGNLWQVGTNGQYATYSDYNAFGSTERVDYGTTGLFATNSYQANNGRLTTAKVSNATADLFHRSYTYFNNGNINSIGDSINNDRSQFFQYDELDRLISASCTVYGGLSFEYDKIGNLIKKDGVIYTSDITGKPHQLISSTDGTDTQYYQYDANGNMVADGERTIAYNADNQPVQVDTGVVTTFEYDGNGSRVKKGNSLYFDDLYECSPTGCAKYIFAGSERIALKRDTEEVYYYHPDHLGGTSLMTLNGAVVEDLFYKPFGETAAQLAGGFNPTNQFTGQEFDAETGLYYYNARYYNPTIGRFTSADTMIPYPDDSQSYNRYSYTRNNPVNFIDPSGHLFLVDDVLRWGYQRLTGATDVGFIAGVSSNYMGSWQTVSDANLWGVEGIAEAAMGVGNMAGGTFSGDLNQVGIGTGQIGNAFYTTVEDSFMDIYGAAIGQLSHLYTFPKDIFGISETIYQGDFLGTAKNLLKTAHHLVIPRYGNAGGAGWGYNSKTGKHVLAPFFNSAINGTDAANFSHDGHEKEHRWVREQFTTNNNAYRASGPLAIGYKMIGLPAFGAAGFFESGE